MGKRFISLSNKVTKHNEIIKIENIIYNKYKEIKMESILSSFEIFQSLVKHDPNMKIDGKTLIEHANTIEQINYLLEHKVNIDVDCATKLVNNSSTEKIKTLLKSNFDMKIFNEFGETFLHRVKSVELIKPLIDAGLDINNIDKHNTSPLEVALSRYLLHHSNEYLQIFETLLQHGAKHYFVNKELAKLYPEVYEIIKKYEEKELCFSGKGTTGRFLYIKGTEPPYISNQTKNEETIYALKCNIKGLIEEWNENKVNMDSLIEEIKTKINLLS